MPKHKKPSNLSADKRHGTEQIRKEPNKTLDKKVCIEEYQLAAFINRDDDPEPMNPQTLRRTTTVKVLYMI